MYYDRAGNPIGMDDWLKISTPQYKRVAWTELSNGIIVSTVWLGLDHNWGEGPPHIFETMLFPNASNYEEIAMERYSTEQAALEGHERLVAEYEPDD